VWYTKDISIFVPSFYDDCATIEKVFSDAAIIFSSFTAQSGTALGRV
jgi:hypothetical protein